MQSLLPPAGGRGAAVLSKGRFLAVETVISHSFPVRRRLEKKSSCRSIRTWCCPGLPRFVHLLLSAHPTSASARMCSTSLGSDVPGAAVLPARATLLRSVTGTGGNFSKTGAEGGSRSPEADPDPTPDGPPADTGPLEGGVQLRSETETQD